MKILVVGSGGREHALIGKLKENQRMEAIYCAPGNAGIAQEGECFPLDPSRPQELLQLALELKADLTVVGPEAPLVAGAVDEFEKAGLRMIGRTRGAARRGAARVSRSVAI